MEYDSLLVLQFCKAYHEAMKQGNTKAMEELSKKLGSIERTYYMFVIELCKMRAQNAIDDKKYDELMEGLSKTATRAYAEGDAKLLEKFEKEITSVEFQPK